MATRENKPRISKKIEKQFDILCFHIEFKMIVE